MPVISCKDCTNYRQHYTFDKRRIFRVHCGHCTFSRPIKKLPDSKPCEHFTLGDPDEAAFVSKEYLSKELLQYLLSLDLLPDIDRAENSITNY